VEDRRGLGCVCCRQSGACRGVRRKDRLGVSAAEVRIACEGDFPARGQRIGCLQVGGQGWRWSAGAATP
jgi:hypothetical protein